MADVKLPPSPYLISEWTGPEMTDRRTWTAYTAEQMHEFAAAERTAREAAEAERDHAERFYVLAVKQLSDAQAEVARLRAELDRISREQWTPALHLALDRVRIEALALHAWELRPYVMLGGAVGWFIVDRGPDGLSPRVVAEVGDRDPRHAIDAAIEAKGKAP